MSAKLKPQEDETESAFRQRITRVTERPTPNVGDVPYDKVGLLLDITLGKVAEDQQRAQREVRRWGKKHLPPMENT